MIQLADLRFLQECVVGPFVRREPTARTGAAPLQQLELFFPPGKRVSFLPRKLLPV